jgi:4-carboxymuconolactone decarboxylase
VVNLQPAPLPLDEAAEAQRAKNVRDQFGGVAAGLVEYTTEYLFQDLWLRPDLAPRDRSLVTVATLIPSGAVAQITYHLNRAMDNELTQEQAAEVIIHLTFYARWLHDGANVRSLRSQDRIVAAAECRPVPASSRS